MLAAIALALMGVSWALGYHFHRALSLSRKDFRMGFITMFATIALSVSVVLGITANGEQELEAGDTATVLAVYDKSYVRHVLAELPDGRELKLGAGEFRQNDWRGIKVGDKIAYTEDGAFQKCGY